MKATELIGMLQLVIDASGDGEVFAEYRGAAEPVWTVKVIHKADGRTVFEIVTGPNKIRRCGLCGEISEGNFALYRHAHQEPGVPVCDKCAGASMP